MDAMAITPPSEASARAFVGSVLEAIRVVVVAGIAYGVVVAGVGSRLAMFLLRLTSPEHVIGMRSDDDFVIGRFTLGGTYTLLVIGAFVGVIGAGAYLLVRPWLVGPGWFRHVTVGIATGAVVGSMLLHADGIDFRFLKPTWFAIGLFVGLPTLFGTFIGPVVDRVAHPASWTRTGWRRWLLPVALVLAFPPVIVLIAFVAAAITVLLALRRVDVVARWRRTLPYGLAVRAVWLAVAAVGMVALAADIRDIARVV